MNILSKSLLPILLVAFTAQAENVRIRVDAGDTARPAAPMSLNLPGKQAVVVRILPVSSADAPLDAQVQKSANGITVRWVEPAMKANESHEYNLSLQDNGTSGGFQYVSGDGYCDLLLGGKPLLRHMYKYESPAPNKSSKPFIHVFGMHDEGLITKGPGGKMESHHRGIFLGFGTQFGNFWDCKDPAVDQHHVKFVQDEEFASTVAARCVELTDWIAKGKLIISDRRQTTTWNLAPGIVLMDFDITMQSHAGDVKLVNNSHHAGFHFRTNEEVEGDKPSLHTGNVTYIRPASANLSKDDEWHDCAWVAANFSIKGNPYTVMHLNSPTNPPSVYSTRPYGRFGASFNDTLSEGKPMNLKYRIIIFDAKKYPNLDLAALTTYYNDFVSPAKAAVEK